MDIQSIGLQAAICSVVTVGSLVAFAILKVQQSNGRVYFPKLYLKNSSSRGGEEKKRNSPSTRRLEMFVSMFLIWNPVAFPLSEHDLIHQAGLDSAAFLRIYLLGLKIFAPITIFALIILVPINLTNDTLEILNQQNLPEDSYGDIDKLSILNINPESNRFWAHILMAYLSTLWTCYILKMEYKKIASMRLEYLASKQHNPDQFTVVVRNFPPNPKESIRQSVDQFFGVNHSDHYLTNQMVYNTNKLEKLVKKKKIKQNWLEYYDLKKSENGSKPPVIKIGFLGLWGDKVDHTKYTLEIQRLSKQIDIERKTVLNDLKCTLPASFVSFKTRWGAAVCAQTKQSKNPILWLTDWAPEPRDIYWKNLAIPYIELKVRKLSIHVALFVFILFSTIAIAVLQSLPIKEFIKKVVPFLNKIRFIKSIGENFLPEIALKLFLIFIPKILMTMSRFEGFITKSSIERNTATKHYFFIVLSIFPGGIIAYNGLQMLGSSINQSPNQILRTFIEAIAQSATFYITFIMFDGWVGPAVVILRLKELIFYHSKNLFMIKTEKDREQATDPGSIEYNYSEPQMQFYFLLGLTYTLINPALLPFMLVFLAFAYFVYRYMVINVYIQEYESAAAFWPDVHQRIVTSLIISQMVLMALLSTNTRTAARFVPFLIVLPVLTLYFHKICKSRYESAFVGYSLEEATRKDSLDRVSEPNINLKEYLEDAYLHPVLKEEVKEVATIVMVVDG